MGVGDVIKMLPVSSCCSSAMHMLVRAASLLPIKATLPERSAGILMRHACLQWEETNCTKTRHGKRK